MNEQTDKVSYRAILSDPEEGRFFENQTPVFKSRREIHINGQTGKHL